MRTVTSREIRRLARRIAEEFHPLRIVLFGSRARGTESPGSDADLLVVGRFRGPSLVQAAAIHARVGGDFPLDILVRTPAEVRRRLAQGDAFLREILRKGRVLYESFGKRAGGKSRRRSAVGVARNASPQAPKLR